MPTSFPRFAVSTLVLVLPAVVWTTVAFADPTFPGASGVGLEPPAGMTPAKGFLGFQAGPASIVITEMPKAAYAQIEQSKDMFVQRFGAKQADDVDIGGAHGFEIKGVQLASSVRFRKWIVVLPGTEETALVSVQAPEDDKTLSDGAIDAALKTIAFRPRPGLDAQVAALPFAVGDLAGFRISSTALGAALILVDGPNDQDPSQSQAHAVVALNVAAPPTADREAFARAQLQAFQAVRTTEITASKLFDADGAQWAEVDAKGSEGPNETPVALRYFVRFGTGDYLTVVGVAPQDHADKDAGRFKTIALSTKPKA